MGEMMFGPMGMVPVDPEELKRQQDEADAISHERRMRVHRFIEELSSDDLGTFNEILLTMLHMQDPTSYINFLHGNCNAILRLKHNACACGIDHGRDQLEAEKAKLDAEREAENDLPAMKEYGLVRKSDGKLYCTGCGIEYQSLDDRMLRPPGVNGCGSCQQKAAWG